MNGIEAVQKAQDLKPDLVGMDIAVPKLDRIEAAKAVRVNSPDCKIVFLAGNDDPEVAREALRTGAYGYVLKADAARELQPALEAAISGGKDTLARDWGKSSKCTIEDIFAVFFC